ncbi:WYL domain-containing protein [Parasalinivibrio latis]|uniref:helix-turn-helix transcriptional regulator n=1 Tax=Parasalinivibrio latis TaxID=2952610 RepID=UPI0030E27770
MKKSSTVNRLQRLDLLEARLKSGEPLTVKGIAEELGISVRTVSRDIDILREQGVPVEAERGRGGGIRLHREWGIGRIRLNYTEAVDLLITLAIAEQMESPMFMANLDGVRSKLIASFSPALKEKVSVLKSRILIAPSASIGVLSGFSHSNGKIAAELHQAFLHQQKLTIRYCDEKRSNTTRTIQPHYLLLSPPVWYVVAWDEWRNDVRTFRCDRIKATEILEQEFRLLPLSYFEGCLEGVDFI